eukprot:190969_1
MSLQKHPMILSVARQTLNCHLIISALPSTPNLLPLTIVSQLEIAPTTPNTINATLLQTVDAESWIPQLICNEYYGIPAYIAVVWNPDTQPQVSHILRIISQHYGSGTPYTGTVHVCAPFAADTSKVNFTQHSLLKYFDTENDLNAYIREDKYAANGYTFANTNTADALRPIAAATVFKSISSDGKQWDYSLRFNASLVPPTFANNEDKIVDRFGRDGSTLSQYPDQYITEIFERIV